MTIKRVTVEVDNPRSKSTCRCEVFFEMDSQQPRAIRVERLDISRNGGEAFTRKISLDSDLGLAAVRAARGLV